MPISGRNEGRGSWKAQQEITIDPSWSVDRATVDYVVGNSVEGDTLNDCDYLDNGDGTQLDAALAQIEADGGGSLFVKKGTYASTARSMTVPLRFWGEGRDSTIISLSTTVRNWLDSSDIGAQGSIFARFQVLVNQATAGASGTEILIPGNGSRCEDLLFSLPSSAGANETLRTGIFVDPDSYYENVHFGPSTANFTPGVDAYIAGSQSIMTDYDPVAFACFRSGGSAARLSITNCKSFGAFDQFAHLENVHDSTFTSNISISLAHEGWKVGGGVSTGRTEFCGNKIGPSFSLISDADYCVFTGIGTRISNNEAQVILVGATGGNIFRLSGTAEQSIVTGNRLYITTGSTTVGVAVDGADDVVVVGNNISADTEVTGPATLRSFANTNEFDVADLRSDQAGGANEAPISDGAGNVSWGAPAPAAHASTHSKGGSDEIDAADLGSASAGGAGKFLRSGSGGGISWVQELQPSVDGAYDIGSNTSRWQDIVGARGRFINLTGAGTNTVIHGVPGGVLAGQLYAVAPGDTARIRSGSIYGTTGIVVGDTYASGGGWSDLAATQAGASSIGAVWSTGGAFSYLNSTNYGSFAAGFAYGGGGTYAEILSTGQGSFCQGLASSRASGRARLSASGFGSFVQGFAQPNTPTGSGKDCYIYATANGAFAQGFASQNGGSGGVATIKAIGQGSFAQGRAVGQGAAATIQSTANGTFAQGTAIGGNLQSSSFGSFAQGYCWGGNIQAVGTAAFSRGIVIFGGTVYGSVGGFANGAVVFSGGVYSTGIGSIGVGHCQGGYLNVTGQGAFGQGSCATGTINSYGGGSFAQGLSLSGILRATGNGAFAQGLNRGTIEATNQGSFAQGGNTAAGFIRSSGYGSFAQGYSVDPIYATANGAFAQGFASSGGIYAAAAGAFAHGSTSAGYPISVTGTGGLALGNSAAGGIYATASNAFQFGPGTNALADSLKVGNAGLHLKGTNGAPGAPANGQFWMNGNYVEFQSNGSAHSWTFPTITGSKGGNAALANLLTALANMGILTDSTT